MQKILDTFCSQTNIHGFSYMVQPSRHRIERIFWILSVLTSFILTGILIHKLVVESQKNPTIIYTDQNVVNVEDLNFPAVTFCPGLLYKTPCRTIIDYERIKAELDSGIIKPENLTLDELKLMQIGSLTARDRFLSQNFPELSVPTDDFLKKLQYFDETFSGHMLNLFAAALWRDQYGVEIVEVLSNSGSCYTFNLPEYEEVYTFKSIFSNFSEMKFYRLGEINFFIHDGFKELEEPYPLKAPSRGQGLLIAIKTTYFCINKFGMQTYNYFLNSIQDSDKDGYSIKFHDPYEVVSKNTKGINTNTAWLTVLMVTPRISKIDENLIDDDANVRNCYLPNEYSLEFFKVYNKVNCEHECLARMTLKSCGCVQFFMARNQSTKICGTFDEKCFRNVEDQFNDIKSTCKCYDACNRIEYEIQLRSVEKPYFQHITYYDKNAYIKIEFAVESVFVTYRKKSQTAIDFLSFVGGLLGLFAGFSVLSGAEIFYYFVAVPLVEIRRRNDSRVHPFVEENQTKDAKLTMKSLVLKFFRDMVEGSTIHSFNHIGSDEKNFCERSIWLILFITSMIYSFFIIENIFNTYKQSTIISSIESSPTSVEDIPFPAFTFIRDLELNVHYFHYDDITNVNYYDDEYRTELCFQFHSMICSSHEGGSYEKFFPKPFTFQSSSDLVDILSYYTFYQSKWMKTRRASWNGITSPPFAETLTSTIFGYTFNLIEQSELLNEELISKDFHYSYDNESELSYPWRTSVGDNNGLSFEVKLTDLYPIYYLTDHCYRRDAMLIHPPNELPIGIEQTSLIRNLSYSILITPEIVKADEDLRSLDVSIRKCYFSDERKLKFFKVYSQKNCELECISHIFNDKCGCIPYNYIRNKSANVCDLYQMRFCITELKFSTRLEKYDHFYETYGTCRCLQECNYVKYFYESYKTSFEPESRFNNTLITIKWKDGEYFAKIRGRQITTEDFLSYVGGILGLFAGISVHSVFELFYFLTLRLVTDMMRYFE